MRVRITKNKRGGYSIRLPDGTKLGNYPTWADADKICSFNFWAVEPSTDQ